MSSAYSDREGACVFQFATAIGEEERKSIAQYAYQLDRQIREIWFQEQSMFVLTRGETSLDDGLRTKIIDWAEKVKTDAHRLEPRVLRTRAATQGSEGVAAEDLRRSGLVREEGPGLLAIEGDLLAFRSTLDNCIRREALAAGAIEHEYPTLIGLDTLVRSGFVGNFPQHVQFVSEMDRGTAALERVQRAGATDVRDPSGIDDAVTTSSLVVSPTVCYHCFRLHQETTLGPGRRLFTALGKCGRKEPFVGALDRLQMFTMREIVVFGSEVEVEDWRVRWMDFAWDLVDRLGLTARLITAFDPFFGLATSKKVYQALVESKYELQLFLPEERRWCAVASFNHHSATLTRAFAIKGEEGALQSGCVGFGYERMIVAIVSQLGLAVQRHGARLPA